MSGSTNSNTGELPLAGRSGDAQEHSDKHRTQQKDCNDGDTSQGSFNVTAL